ncbi:MAG: hypothetical protein LUD29_06465 [Clostridia bacterium]|nr:hypothetical protein [Clostridia bacterium]
MAGSYETHIKVTDNEINRQLFKSILALYENERKNCAGDESSSPFYENISDDSALTISISDVSEGRVSFRYSSEKSGEYIRTYELSSEPDSSRLKIGFEEDGATWFKNLRYGEALESPDSDWAGMRDRVAAAYHRKYYSVEFYINDQMSGNAYERECRDFLSVFGDLMRDELHVPEGEEVFTFDAACLTRSSEVYYRAKLRVDATLGVGQPMPLICYVYYKLDEGSNELTIMDREVAKEIDGAIKTNLSMEKGSGGGSNERDLDMTNREIRIKLDEDFNGDSGDEIFNRCRFLTDTSRETLAKGQTTGVSDELHLDCKGIKLLSVAKVNWPTLKFRASFRQQEVFELNYNINGISLRCINCGLGSRIVENNNFKFAAGREPKEPVCIYEKDAETQKPVKDRESMKRYLLGLKEKGTLEGCNLFEHLTVLPTCGRAKELSSAACERLVCKSQLIIFGDEGEEKTMYCRDCRYAEIVYKDPYDGTARPTSLLFHNVLTSRMVTNENERKCRLCALSYEEKDLSSGLCPTCRSATRENDDGGLYKAYCRVLPMGARIRALRARHVCFENSAILVFGVGDRYYKFDKLDLQDRGYISPAVKIGGKK